ncbi:hypothetical protein [Oleiagrimonas sp. C23AA]|uniref:hypothetical protein n=1 Tax=Oleiagrimonas sp. C23AA TaxID=2719047 RepID=UPI0014216929|nr:hypothetical protein [Oleiagrimonas sp. C23AA]NII11292.1 hypothetical protein [Oleiagrimonas sp. C23AA]
MKRDYEDLQLRLIGREYEREGYSVSFEVAFPGLDTRFDAVAHRESDGDLVIIELVNAERSPASRGGLEASLEAVTQIYPRTRVDIRRIDPEVPGWTRLLWARQRSTEHLRTVLPKAGGEPDSDAFQRNAAELLQLWAGHASVLRAFAALSLEGMREPATVLAIYNALLAAGLLQPPEVVVNGVELDLFQLYDLAIAALQGSFIEPAEVEQLRKHVLSVRSQVARVQVQG